jgi:hypothetical protein
MGRRRKDRESHWRDILQRQAASGMSVAVFCRQKSISGPSFYSWRRRLKMRDANSQEADHQADIPAASVGQLLPVRIESINPPETMRILTPRGVSLDVPSNIDPGALAGLLRALRETNLC